MSMADDDRKNTPGSYLNRSIEPKIRQDFIEKLTEVNIARAKVWMNGKPRGLEFATIELCGAVGEVADAVKKYLRFKLGVPGGVKSIEPIADEIADAFICLNLLSIELGIDIRKAVRKKFNQTSEEYNLPHRL